MVAGFVAGAGFVGRRTDRCISSTGSSFVAAQPIVGRQTLVPEHARRSITTPTMGLFGLGFPELLVIGGVAAVVFGPNKISELGKNLGSVAGSVKKATNEFQDAMQESIAEADKELEAKKMAPEAENVVEATTTAPAATTPPPAAAPAPPAPAAPAAEEKEEEKTPPKASS